jgi:hypothetical protein
MAGDPDEVRVVKKALLEGDWIGSHAVPVSVVDAGRLTGRVRRVVAAVV